MPKLIIFDAGDILYHVPKRKEYEPMIENFFIKHRIKNISKADEEWLKIFPLVNIGKISLEEAHKRWLKAIGLNENLVNEWKELDHKIMKKFMKIKTGVKSGLVKLKRQGYKLAVLSDSVHPKKTKEWIFSNIGINGLFDGIFTSHDIGYAKPHKNAFYTVIKHFKAKKKDVVFVGHSKDELNGARLLGIKTIAIKPEDGAKYDYLAKKFSDIPKLLRDINLNLLKRK